MKFSFITIGTRHLDASIEFYTKLLKFKLDRRYQSGPDVNVAFLTDGKYMIEFIQGDFIKAFSGEGVSLGFEVDDIDKTFVLLRKHQVEIIDEPHMLANGMRMMHAIDLNGMALGFVQYPK